MQTLTSSKELTDLIKDMDAVFHSKQAGSSKLMLNSLHGYVPLILQQLQVDLFVHVFVCVPQCVDTSHKTATFCFAFFPFCLIFSKLMEVFQALEFNYTFTLKIKL